jgi:hypothetical protein
MIIAAASQSITVKALTLAGFIFTGGWLIKLPAPDRCVRKNKEQFTPLIVPFSRAG